MKKIFFMAVSAVLLAAGCQKTEIQNEVLPKIGFDTHVGKLTKAYPDAENPGKLDNLKAQGFMVWGYFATPNDLNYNLYDLYLGGDDLGIEVTPGTNNDWTTGDIYYWPGKRKELDLYAVSLWNAQTEGNTYAGNVEIYPENNILNVNGFTVNNAADDDLMVAPLIRQDQDDDEIVAPQFQHALAKVLVKFTTSATASEGQSSTGVYIKGVSLTKVKNSGDLTVVNVLGSTPVSGPTESTATLTWTPRTTTHEYTAVYNANLTGIDPVNGVSAKNNQTGETTTYDGVVPLTATPVTFGSWLLIPQDLTDDVKLVVEYIVDDNFATAIFDLKAEGTTVEKWEKGMQTTYNVKIAPEYITFTPTVGDWANEYEERGDYEEVETPANPTPADPNTPGQN